MFSDKSHVPIKCENYAEAVERHASNMSFFESIEQT